MQNRELFLRHLAQTSDFPLSLEIESAEGSWLIAVNGERYLDLISGIAVSNVGHRHKNVITAIQNQLDKYLHLMVYGEYIQAPQVKLAHKLVSLLPSNLNNVYLVNSGSEAVEGAMKLAKRFTGRPNIVSFNKAYHGSTQGALSIIGDESFKQPFRPLIPGVIQVEYDSENALSAINTSIAAVFVEGVRGEAGYLNPDIEFIQDLRKKCTETGTLLVFDEIQTGFGRTGKWFSFEHFDVIPDIITIAKGMGGGMPIGAFIASNEIMSVLKSNPILGHITTFGGNAVCAAASLAVIETIEQEKLIDQIETKEKLFYTLIHHPAILSMQGKGLMLSLEFESFEILQQIIQKCLEGGVITDWFLFNDKSMRICPPLTISENEIRFACETINNAIMQVCG